MKTLDELTRIDGAISAFEFSPEGKLIDYRTNTLKSPEYLDMSSHFCATVSMLFNTLANAFTRLSDESWIPQKGWMYSGGQYTVCIGNYRGLVVETEKADFNQIFKALVSEEAKERFRMAA